MPDPIRLRTAVDGIPVTMLQRSARPGAELTAAETDAYVRLVESACRRARLDILLAWGSDPLAGEVRSRARRLGIATVLVLDNLRVRNPIVGTEADAVLVPWRFAADYYREALGLDCIVLPPPVDPDRVRAEQHEPQYVTFVASSVGAGVYPFARIATELTRRRPDIPLLVVADQGTEPTLAGCGLDLRAHGNIQVMAPTSDPRAVWGVTRLCLLPAVSWEEAAPRLAVEALLNSIPVLGSDRGALPEIVGPAGQVLPLPERLTPATRGLPTAEEIVPWIDAIIHLWDDADHRAELSRRAREEARRWEPEVLGPQYVRVFSEIRPGPRPPARTPPGRSKAVVLVPHLNGIDPECEQALDQLEQAGVRVVRRVGSSQIDLARSEMASDALHDGYESILFIDADIGFDPYDALRLLARPEAVVAGVYAKKSRRQLACTFPPEITEILFGPEAPGLYPLQYAATGFLRIRTEVLRRMIAALDLPHCNTKWGRGVWPFFLSLIVPHPEGGYHYLGEDWSFSHRLRQIGVTPLADTSFRLWHWGRYGYSWEDAGADHSRYRTYAYRLE